MAYITYITGGERSGKSSFAQQLALSKAGQPYYVATARRVDEDFAQRIARHQDDRSDNWKLIEEPLHLGNLDLAGEVAVIDCITLWLSNIFFDNEEDPGVCLKIAKQEWSGLIRSGADLIVVSNEIGMGVHGNSPTTRKFVELQGWMNQHIASASNEAWLLVSGLPVKIK